MICAHNYIHNLDFVPRIWSQPNDKDCLYILSSSKNSLSYTLTSRDNTLSLSLHCDLQRQHTLSLSLSLSLIFWLPETTLTLFLSILIYKDSTHSLSSLRLPETAWLWHNSIRVTWVRLHSTTFFFLVLSFQLDLFQPQTQPQKFRQAPKETNNQHGRRHIPPKIHCYILYIDTLHEILTPHTFYSLQDTFNS